VLKFTHARVHSCTRVKREVWKVLQFLRENGHVACTVQSLIGNSSYPEHLDFVGCDAMFMGEWFLIL
jgi:hypothetical protein